MGTHLWVMGGRVFCGSTRGRWVPLKKAYRIWIVAEWCHPLSLPVSGQQVFPTVVGDLDSSGSLNAQVLLLLAERLRAKAVFQVTPGSCLPPPTEAFIPSLSSLSVLLWGSRERKRGNSDGKEGGRCYFLPSLPRHSSPSS